MDVVFKGGEVSLPAACMDGIAPVETFDDPSIGPVRVFDAGDEESVPGPFRPLRDLFAAVDAARFGAAVRAFQLLHCRRTYRFCPRCGEALVRKDGADRAMRCASCRADFFPRIDVAVIMAVEFEGKLLLAEREASGGGRIWSLIAGFVEPGETLEEAARREAMEEVGIEFRDLEYIRSQPWPYPSQLMVGFRAKAKSGVLRPDGAEVKRAAWHSPDALPANLPNQWSIARFLIDAWLGASGERE